MREIAFDASSTGSFWKVWARLALEVGIVDVSEVAAVASVALVDLIESACSSES